jgi:hypothetical protein
MNQKSSNYKVLIDPSVGINDYFFTRYYFYNYKTHAHVMVSRLDREWVDFYLPGIQLPEDIELDELKLYLTFY